MKKYLFVFVLSSFLLTSCGTNLTLFYDSSNQVTQVELSENNFTVVERVSGEADNMYILGIGGMSDKALLGQAKNNMMEKADLIGTSRAMVNTTFDRHVYGVPPFYYVVHVTASGYVVEFTE